MCDFRNWAHGVCIEYVEHNIDHIPKSVEWCTTNVSPLCTWIFEQYL